MQDYTPVLKPHLPRLQGLLHEEDFNERIMAALRGMQPDRAVRALQYLSHAVSAEQLSGASCPLSRGLEKSQPSSARTCTSGRSVSCHSLTVTVLAEPR